MILKIFKAVWFLTLLGFLANLLYTYAGLPEQLRLPLQLDTSAAYVTFSKEFFFYFFLAAATIVNGSVFILRSIFPHQKSEPLLAWFYGLICCINFFLIVAMSFTGLSNSPERFNYAHVGWIIYGSILLIIVWIISWPVYYFFNKLATKQAV